MLTRQVVRQFATRPYLCAMLTIYGIKNCDVMAKAFKWLKANNIPYTFHNYREQPLDAATVEVWLAHLPAEQLINKKSTTYRELPQADKAALEGAATRIPVLLQHPTLFKRPLLVTGNGTYLTGWKEAEFAPLLAALK